MRRTRRARVAWRYENIAPSTFYAHRDWGTDGGWAQGLSLVDKRGFTWALKDAHRFNVEATAELQVLQHTKKMPFNMALHEVYSTQTKLYLVMPMLRHGPLDRFMEDRADLFSKSWRSILAQIAFGLWELHQRGVIHRNLKTENIMILDDAGNNVTLIDYNQAATGCREKDGQACDARTSAFGGNQAWAPFLGNPYSYEVDWWYFGVLLHNFSFGQPPWQGPAWQVAARASSTPLA